MPQIDETGGGLLSLTDHEAVGREVSSGPVRGGSGRFQSVVQAQYQRTIEPQLVVGAQHPAVIAVDVEALVDRDACGVGSASSASDHDVGPVVAEGSGR